MAIQPLGLTPFALAREKAFEDDGELAVVQAGLSRRSRRGPAERNAE
jgi:hypothetical protein